MKPIILLACAGMMVAQSAHALSCMRPNIARSFNDFAASDDTYVLGFGKITATQKIVNPNKGKDGTAQHESYSVQASFSGRFMGDAGWGDPKTLPVNVQVQCLSVWCGGFPTDDQDAIAYFQKTSTGYVLQMGPCGGHYKASPTLQEQRILKSCFRNKKCSNSQIEKLGGTYR
ncbi:hypothetical protein GCM10008927_12710 [Amylibacter ulvae]|uniref:Uncharacterized protein n=1 Tax=Paramylibacter ulvae TaxID=1651968 RepID=A0ABQ3CY94_9RHOB|nr:hypothetical protein [Amylibacter ulvae]GHA49016.1 hypothetical protein GCM10008927_12710 [Amylibacter ulvae]